MGTTTRRKGYRLLASVGMGPGQRSSHDYFSVSRYQHDCGADDTSQGP